MYILQEIWLSIVTKLFLAVESPLVTECIIGS